MLDQNLQLKSTKLSENQRNLLNDKSNADVVLIVGEDKKEVYCNSFPLIATSKYYAAAIKDIWKKRREDGMIVLNHPEFKEQTIIAIVEFCYTGFVDVKDDIIPLIYEAADYLEIQELVDICVIELENGLGDNAGFKFLSIAFKLNRTDLILDCLEIALISGWESFFSKENLEDLSQELLVAIINLSRFNDVDKWLLIKRWGFALNESTTTKEEDQQIGYNRILNVLTILRNNFIILQFTDDEYEAHLSPFLVDITDNNVQTQFQSFFSHFKVKTIMFKRFAIKSKVTSNPLLFQKISESIVSRHFPTWTQFQRTKKRSTSNAKNTIVVCNTQNQTKTIQWELLYRGSENSFSAAAFHRLCDEKVPTITLVKSTNGRVAAAYNSEDWVSDYNKNPHGFILKVDMVGVEVITIRFDVFDGDERGNDNDPDWGPCFGSYNYGGYDHDNLAIADKCNENENSFSHLGNTYKGPGASETSLFGSCYFQVEEYEVFSVKFT